MTACARSRAPILAKMWLTWLLTVAAHDDQPLGDLGVGEAGGDQREHLRLVADDPR
jgi:hypothetical protein